MAIVSVGEKKGVRSGSKNELWQRTFTRVFQVITDTPTDGPLAVMEAVDPLTGVAVPAVGASYSTGYEYDDGSFVQSLKAQEVSEDGKQWDVSVEYGPYNAGLFPVDVISWPFELTVDGQKYERAITKDVSGNAIVNSAKSPFQEPVTVDDSRTLIKVVRNEPILTYDFTLAELYNDKVNNATWNGYAAKTVKCSGIVPGKAQYDSNTQTWYFAVTYTFEVNRDTWTRNLLDQGFCVLDSSSPPKQKAVKGVDGQPVSDPVLLDGSGNQLATTGTPVFLSYEVYPAVDFGVFNMDFATALGRS